MFNPSQTLIQSFVTHLGEQYVVLFADARDAQIEALNRAARTALQTLLNCDCPYHDIEHTILVTEIGQVMLQGRQRVRRDLSADDGLQTLVALLFHDVGYVRGLLPEDGDHKYVISEQGERVEAPAQCTDAFMTPYHVTRGSLFVRKRFAQDPEIDPERVAECIEMTRFPVPKEAGYQTTDSLAALVRSADLLGQMADPQYFQKLARLFVEFVEIGEDKRLGLRHPGDLRARFTDFFTTHVEPYVGEGLEHLEHTQEGQQWLANLNQHLQDTTIRPHTTPMKPTLVVGNG